ncbi:MAG TPA: ParB/RepB/Spo0J family partition protein [Candidatus Corynebacterium gallistercoris]|uniref:ParB/RepB/Spo0J family partition protein n=1 Tax=Candidatus Corynebacterium gallistercoris TaxID=2838530 RepID=A0A9D1UPC3_9CORY|nr:ParB/RepB/Spo0J family partition protein [Candidatus Corynebacterium gallistercoris]
MAEKKKPAMPAASAVTDSRRGGLGRGLASLIPSGPAKPSLGNGAADIVLGSGAGGSRNQDNSVPSDKRHSDKTGSNGSKAQNSRINISNQKDFGASYQELPLVDIRTNAKQPRSVFDEEALQELVHSLREFGLMQPIVVRHSPAGRGRERTEYELIMGERRLRAAKLAGFDVIPAIIRETEDDAMLRDALLENIHRVQLNPLEEAAAYQQLMEEFGVTQEQLAKKIGRSRPLITNMIRLMQLPVAVQRRVGAGVLSAGHARALLGLKAGAEAQERLAERIVAEGMSVRATEEAVTLLNRDGGNEDKKKRRQGSRDLPPAVRAWAEDVSDTLETKVSVQMGKKKGKIVVEFSGPEDFDRIIELMKFHNE